MKLGELVESYLQWRTIASGNETTPRAYRKDLGKLLEVVGVDSPAEELDIFALHRFQIELENNSGLCSGSIGHALACIKGFVKWAHNEGIYRENFAAVLQGPRRHHTIPYAPTAEQMNTLLDGGCPTSWPERDRVVVELLYCNLRVSEVAEVELADLVAADEVVVKGKGRKERKVPLTAAAQQALAQYLPRRRRFLKKIRRKTDALFVNLTNGGRLTTRSMGRIVKAIARAKGLPEKITPHRLRAACATHMLDKDAPMSAVSQLLGHAKAETTMRYCGGISPRRMREAYDRAFQR
jgi:integrase/recombinase XerC